MFSRRIGLNYLAQHYQQQKSLHQKKFSLSYHSDFQVSIHITASIFLALSPAMLYLVLLVIEWYLSKGDCSDRISENKNPRQLLFIQQLLFSTHMLWASLGIHKVPSLTAEVINNSFTRQCLKKKKKVAMTQCRKTRNKVIRNRC